jgi:ribosome-binding protein aMBF1 (putative translation factor)
MQTCKRCGEEVDELVMVKVDSKAHKMCADCAELVEEQATVAQESESAVQNMMGYKGRR